MKFDLKGGQIIWYVYPDNYDRQRQIGGRDNSLLGFGHVCDNAILG